LLLNGDKLLTENNESIEFLNKLIEESTTKFQSILALYQQKHPHDEDRNYNTGYNFSNSHGKGSKYNRNQTQSASSGVLAKSDSGGNNFMDRI
jgi:hypothetical protein